MTLSPDDLAIALLEFDGKNTQTLLSIAGSFCREENYAACLLALLSEGRPNHHDGSSWLLKHHLENGAHLDERETALLTQKLTHLQNWQAQLHICQLVQYLSLTENQVQKVAAWLHPLLTHNRPFLRAWSVSALVDMSHQHKSIKAAAETALAAAKQDSAASVRARVKKLTLE
jgi:hypothetical protein